MMWIFGSNQMIFLWLAALIGFGVLEAATVSLTSIWFCGGSIAAVIAAALGASVLVQVTLFVLVSVVLLACLRPFARNVLKSKKISTNADRVIGETAVVADAIDNLAGKGSVKIGGITWTARAQTNEVIPVGTVVRVNRIEGVKVFVTPAQEPAAVK